MAVDILLDKTIKVYQFDFAISLDLNDNENTDFCWLSKFYLLTQCQYLNNISFDLLFVIYYSL